jgi:hypothetical protein
MSVTFHKHGDFEMRIDGRLLLADLYGPWNDELLDAFWTGLKPFIFEMERSVRWGSIYVLHGSAMMSHEGLALYKTRTAAYRLGSRRVAAAIVIGREVEGYGLMEQDYRNCYDGICSFETFERLPDARDWALNLINGPKL